MKSSLLWKKYEKQTLICTELRKDLYHRENPLFFRKLRKDLDKEMDKQLKIYLKFWEQLKSEERISLCLKEQ